MSVLTRLSWKRVYYGAILRSLQGRDAARADVILSGLGRAATLLWPPCRRRAQQGAARARACLDDNISERAFIHALATSCGRSAARDYLLDELGEPDLAARFEVEGCEALDSALATSGEVIIVGCHLGAYIPALHWLCRRMPLLRMVVQRPTHVGRLLNRRFADDEGLFPQARLLLRRGLSPAESARRVLQARSALRGGVSLYLCGDIPWPRGYSVNWLGARRHLVGLWADLAADTGRPVMPVFAYYESRGRYRVEFDAPFHVEAGGTHDAVRRYAARLEEAVAACPAQAVAYWTWPAYAPTHSEAAAAKFENRTSALDAKTHYTVRPDRMRRQGIMHSLPRRPAS